MKDNNAPPRPARVCDSEKCQSVERSLHTLLGAEMPQFGCIEISVKEGRLEYLRVTRGFRPAELIDNDED